MTNKPDVNSGFDKLLAELKLKYEIGEVTEKMLAISYHAGQLQVQNTADASRLSLINELRKIINSIEHKDLVIGNNYLCDVICKADLLQKLSDLSNAINGKCAVAPTADKPFVDYKSGGADEVDDKRR